MTVFVGMLTCNLGSDYRIGINPFTKEKVKFYSNPGLNEQEKEAVANILRRVNAKGPDADGFWKIRLGDNSQFNFGCGDLTANQKLTGMEMDTEEMTEGISNFLYEVAIAGNVCITSTVKTDIMCMVREPTAEHLERWLKLVVVNSPGQLHQWIMKSLV